MIPRTFISFSFGYILLPTTTTIPLAMRIKSALGFVLTIGIVNLFADLTYEGARGIVGPFLGSLGASAAVGRICRWFRRANRICVALGFRLFLG